MKYCPACKQDKPEDAFYVEAKRPGGLSSNCKACKNASSRANWPGYYETHKAELIQKVIERRRTKRDTKTE